MAWKACAELFNERRNEMQNTSDELKFKRNFKRALIVFAVVEFIVTAVGLFYYVQK